MSIAIAAVLTAAMLVTTVIAVRRRIVIVEVHGDSMSPTFAPGDQVLIRRRRFDAVRRGDVVVIAPPHARPDMAPADRLHIKRVAALPGDPVPAGIPVTEAVVPAGRLVVLGDNVRHSADSRAKGFYRADDLVGVVVRRTRPAGRRSVDGEDDRLRAVERPSESAR